MIEQATTGAGTWWQRLHGTAGFLNTKSKPTADNAIVLAAISVVKKRPAPPLH